MSLGQSKIIKKSNLKPEWRDVFLTAKFFTQKPVHTGNLEEFTNYFTSTNPTNNVQKYILELLDQEGIDYSNKKIEYWFQHQVPGQSLPPHCDYNHSIREAMRWNDKDRWLHTVDKTKVMSPVTLACYIEVENMVGGDLCISDVDWTTVNDLSGISNEYLEQYPYEVHTPVLDEVLHFEGSRYYHWITPVRQGSRKSMLINFWPTDL
jgi:hypothetical protein